MRYNQKKKSNRTFRSFSAHRNFSTPLICGTQNAPVYSQWSFIYLCGILVYLLDGVDMKRHQKVGKKLRFWFSFFSSWKSCQAGNFLTSLSNYYSSSNTVCRSTFTMNFLSSDRHNHTPKKSGPAGLIFWEHVDYFQVEKVVRLATFQLVKIERSGFQ